MGASSNTLPTRGGYFGSVQWLKAFHTASLNLLLAGGGRPHQYIAGDSGITQLHERLVCQVNIQTVFTLPLHEGRNDRQRKK